jgi:hypothetical protein
LNPLSDLVSQAMALLDAEPELYRMADEMHRHFVGEAIDANPRELVPGLVLRWLHCACDLELWQEGLAGSPPRHDVDRTLDFVARLEDLGVEPVGEKRCIDCEHRKRCV